MSKIYMVAGGFLVRNIMAATCVLCIGSTTVTANDLTEELDYLLRNDPQLKAASANWRSSQHNVTKNFASYFPQLGVSGDIGPERVDSPDRQSTNGSASNLVREKGTIDLSYNLFDGFEKEALYEQSQHLGDRTLNEYYLIRSNVMAEGIKAYINAKGFYDRKQLAMKELATIETGVVQQKQLVDQGGALSIDLLQAQSRLSLAQDRLLFDEDSLARSIATYERYFGRIPTFNNMTDLPITFVGLPVSLDEAMMDLRENNPDLIASDYQEKEATESIEIARSDYYPTFSIVGMADWEKNVDASRGTSDTQSVLLQGSWKLFDGYATSSSESVALENRYAVRDQKNLKRLNYENFLTDAWVRMESSLDRIDQMNETLALNRDILKAQQDQVDAGRETAITLIDQQSVIYTLEKEIRLLQVAAQTASIEVLQVTANLTPALFDLASNDPVLEN